MSNPSAIWPIEPAAPEDVGLSSKRLQRINDLMHRYIQQKLIAGVITLVVRKNRIAHLQCFGHMDLERQIPMREDALFRVYSMTKLVTSAAVLMLMEDGHFLLKEPLKKFLPEFAETKVAVTGADGKEELVRPRRDITIHDLLTHLAGMSYDLTNEARQNAWTLARFSAEFAKRPLRHHPGTKWDYSASVDVLGRLVEVVSGMPFESFLNQRIFSPLGMTDTDFYVPPEKRDRLAQVYAPSENGGLTPASDLGVNLFFQKPFFPSGGGGLISSTPDFLRFALAFLHGQWNGFTLLSRKTHELMTADHMPPANPAIDINCQTFAFGLGVSVIRRLGETTLLATPGEFGWGGAACTQLWLDPAEDMISMLMLQLRPKQSFPLMDLFHQSAHQALL